MREDKKLQLRSRAASQRFDIALLDDDKWMPDVINRLNINFDRECGSDGDLVTFFNPYDRWPKGSAVYGRRETM